METFQRPKVVIAGGSGFVGRAAIDALREQFDVIALSRSEREAEPGLEWRACDLFSLLQCEQAVEGADYALYLVHSMLPARLTQANFVDMDLILADNFARATKKAGVRQIVYLGGLIPQDGSQLSKHLASGLEVEGVLAAREIPVTTLRAGLIIGAGGSSFQMMTQLVKRLPVMLCPRWTLSKTQPVALADIVRAIQWSLARPEAYGKSYDVAGPDVMTYQEMMQRTALSCCGKKRWVASVPLFSPGLSVAWIQLITGAHGELVRPLVQSLRHDMCARPQHQIPELAESELSIDDALQKAIDGEAKRKPVRSRLSRAEASSRAGGYVVSIQRLPLPPGKDAEWVAREYARWLPRLLRFVITVRVDEQLNLDFVLLGFREPLLRLSYSASRSTSDRPLYYITGGRMTATPREEDHRTPARLEFRETPDRKCVMAAIFNFRPRLPWLIYRLTQAPVHLVVMKLFGRHLGRVQPTIATD